MTKKIRRPNAPATDIAKKAETETARAKRRPRTKKQIGIALLERPKGASSGVHRAGRCRAGADLCGATEAGTRHSRVTVCEINLAAAGHAVSLRSCRIVEAPEFPFAPVVPPQAQNEGFVPFDPGGVEGQVFGFLQIADRVAILIGARPIEYRRHHEAI